jgi:hypothetical protein
MSSRTLAILVVIDNETNVPETISIFIPFSPNNKAELNEYVRHFCLQKKM